MAEYDAVVVGSGPNGLAAALTLALRGLKVVVLEARATPGGGARTWELTLPGFRHDVCSAIHPMGLASPFFRKLHLERYGLQWIHPPVPAGHALDEGAVLLHRDIGETARGLGSDGERYRALFQPVVDDWDLVDEDVLGPLGLPKHPLAFLRFGLRAPWPAKPFLKLWFRTPQARALLAGVAAHSTLPLEWFPSFSAGFVLSLVAHRYGWPMAEGGSQSIIDALVALLQELGGEVVCDSPVASLAQLPPSKVVLLDLTPRQLLQFPEVQASRGWAQRLYRWQLGQFRYGPGSFKIDYALSSPIPWRDKRLTQAGTVHLGGPMEEIALPERLAWRGVLHPRPYVLVAQHSLFDTSRAPAGQHTAWAYCHVPHGFRGPDHQAIDAIEGQLERFAPGFRDCVLEVIPKTACKYFKVYNFGECKTMMVRS